MTSEKIPESIADRYQVKGVLGKGGMGFVLQAYDPLLGIDVALKLMKSDDSGFAAARMQREAMAAGKMKHANIARVYDFGQTPLGEPYMVMELLAGESLSEKIIRTRPKTIDIKEAVDIFIQIIDGLQSAHSQGIVHRDLKPDNVFLLKNNLVKLVDFGIAKIGAGDQMNTSKGDFEGSPLYMSPEQAQGLDADPRSDLYSFGCLMFEVLTGRPPFVGKSPLETISLQINSPAPSFPEAIAVPSELVELTQKCLAKNVDARPQNCDEVTDYLEAARLSLQEQEPAEKPVAESFSNRSSKKKISKMPLTIGVSLTLLVLAGAFTVLSMKKHSVATTTVVKTEAETDPEKEAETVAPAWTKAEAPLPVEERKFEFAEDKGVYMARPKVAIVDEDLKQLKGYNRLKNLFLDYTKITGSGLAYVDDLPLKYLSITYGNILDEAILHIVKMKTLERLEIGTPNLTDNGFKQLRALPNLTRLCVGSDKFTDKSIDTINKLPDLYTFSLYAPQMSEAVVPALYKMKNLNNLCLVKLKLKPDIGVKLAKIRTLQTLGIIEIPAISDQSLKALSKLTLYWLDLGGITLGDNQLATLPSSLTGIGLRKTGVSAKNLENLKKLPDLTVLNLGENKITDEHAKIISHLKLTELSLAKADLTFKQFLMFSNIPDLQKLDIRDCAQITPAQLQEFQSIFRLKHRKECEVMVGSEVPVEAIKTLPKLD